MIYVVKYDQLEAEAMLRERFREDRERFEPNVPRFARVWCSQCGCEFGPGDHGFSHCENHSGTTNNETM